MTKLPSGSWQQLFYMIINQASNFAVPSFIFVSGFVLCYNYKDKVGLSWVSTFYKKRFLFILIPYILWSYFYFVYSQHVSGSNAFDNIHTYWNRLLTGKNYTHLYYFVIIIQLYILFPLFIKLIQSVTFIRKHLLLVALIVQIAFFLCNYWWFNIGQTGTLFITYFSHFFIGAWVGVNYEEVMKQLKKYRWLCVLIFATAMLLFIFASKIYYVWLPFLLPYKVFTNFIIYYSFTLSASLSLLMLSQALYRFQKSWFMKSMLYIGKASFAIYLLHPFFLALWRSNVIAKYGQYYNYLTILGGLVSLLASLLVYVILKKSKYSWILIGK